jgi:anti-sigma factor (TIGR02949 family)
LNCREFADFLNLYLDAELPPGEREEFERHLAECPDCVAYLDGYRKTVRVLRRLDAADEQPPEELIQAILAARRSPAP